MRGGVGLRGLVSKGRGERGVVRRKSEGMRCEGSVMKSDTRGEMRGNEGREGGRQGWRGKHGSS